MILCPFKRCDHYDNVTSHIRASYEYLSSRYIYLSPGCPLPCPLAHPIHPATSARIGALGTVCASKAPQVQQKCRQQRVLSWLFTRIPPCILLHSHTTDFRNQTLSAPLSSLAPKKTRLAEARAQHPPCLGLLMYLVPSAKNLSSPSRITMFAPPTVIPFTDVVNHHAHLLAHGHGGNPTLAMRLDATSSTRADGRFSDEIVLEHVKRKLLRGQVRTSLSLGRHVLRLTQ